MGARGGSLKTLTDLVHEGCNGRNGRNGHNGRNGCNGRTYALDGGRKTCAQVPKRRMGGPCGRRVDDVRASEYAPWAHLIWVPTLRTGLYQ